MSPSFDSWRFDRIWISHKPAISRREKPFRGARPTVEAILEDTCQVLVRDCWDALSSGADRQRYLQLLSDNLYTLPCGQLRMELNVHVRLWSHARVFHYSPNSARAL